MSSASSFNPGIPTQKTYPAVARCLQEKDIGQQIVKVELCASGIGRWSFIPLDNDPETIRNESVKLSKLTDRDIILVNSNTYNLNGDWLGPYWATAEELIEYLKDNPSSDTLSVPVSSHSLMRMMKSQTTSPLMAMQSQMTPQFIKNQTLLKLIDCLAVAAKIVLKNHPTSLDYSFYPPDPDSSSKPQGGPITPNLFSDEPHEILGIHPGEKDLTVIKKRFNGLALKHHPDKGGDATLYEKIRVAYEKLTDLGVKKLFRFSEDSLPKTKLTEATQYKNLFKQMVFTSKEIAVLLPLIDHFLKELSSVDSGSFKDKFFEFMYNNLIKDVSSLQNYYTIKQQLLSMELPNHSMDLNRRYELGAKVFEELSTLGSSQFNFSSLEQFNSVYSTILDKYTACQRVIAESYLEDNKIDELANLSSERLKFITKLKENFQCQVEKALKEKEEFQQEMKKLKQPISKLASLNFEKVTSLVNNVQNNKKSSPKPSLFTFDDELKALHKNIEKNFSFLKALNRGNQ